MKTIQRFLSLLLLTTFITVSANAQFFEDFEGGNKTFYNGETVPLETGNWYLDDALLGNGTNDKFNGSKGVRMDRRDGKTGNIYMQFDKLGGADEISFAYANYGSSTGNKLQVQYSTDQGATWVDLGSELTPSSTLETATLSVNIEGNIRFKFIQSAGDDRLNFDDVNITDFVVAQDDATISVLVGKYN